MRRPNAPQAIRSDGPSAGPISREVRPQHRAATHRLIHMGLIDETPAGFSLTEAGDARLRAEARKLGLPVNDGPSGGPRSWGRVLMDHRTPGALA
jgi:hypothetical protein